MIETTEFKTNYEELEISSNDDVVGVMWLVPTDGKRTSEYLSYPPRLVPKDGRYLPAPYAVRVSVSDDRLPISASVGPVVSIHQFEGRIFGFEFDAPTFKLLDPDTGDLMAQIQLHPDHLPEWLGDEGDTCYIAIRLECDHERMLDHRSEAEIEEKRARFQEQVEEKEEFVSR